MPTGSLPVTPPASGPAPAHAGVHFPPPFIYVAGFLVGWLLDRWRRAPITAGDSVSRDVVATFFVVLYFAVFVSALATFRRKHTTLIPNRPATALATGGPYRFTRNPMYVSMALLYLGVALFTNSWWIVGMLAVVLIVVDRAVIAREERYLSSAFPAEYAAYRASVRRWL